MTVIGKRKVVIAAVIIVLCDSFEQASDSYFVFLDFMTHNAPWDLRYSDVYSNRIVTYDDLTFVFLHRGYLDYIDDGESDIIEVDDFFNDILDLYAYGY